MSPWRAALHNAVGLGLFAAVTVGAIALTAALTSDRIATNQERVRQAALLEILAPGRDSALEFDLSDSVSLMSPALGHRGPKTAVRARLEDQVVALLVPLRIPDGYSGDIHLLLGIEADGRIAGARVVEHRETPGLGDPIDRRKSDWIDSFRGRSLGDPPLARWTVRREGGDFDAFTGATITPRAVARGIGRALVWFEEDGRELLEASP
ncbi:MAG: electron transport complex subunit RsxG [Gammaproteobacteria bacterium]|nr:electron transport complex subunit RsxG [Gammaproteobacteria bacterium]